MGSPIISVVAVIDLDGKHVRLAVTGELTVDTQTALHPLIRLAGVLTPVTRVVVDLTDAQITDTAAVETLTRHVWDGHTGHPSQRVRFTLPDPMLLADAADLQQLRAEQRSWASPSTAEDPHSTVRNINTAPAHPQATPVTATVRHRTPRPSPTQRTAQEYDHAAAATAQPAASTQHVTIAAEPTTGTVLPFRRPRHRPGRRTQPTTPMAGTTTPGQIEAR
ncbi:hypothetical protein MRU69_02670 [Kocuria flava]|uniref:hypothetical protein n=1 Tax=Kocuria flava TaxID=446860 RepID=UPI001FF414A9|nr:hypothetical protein [Kocuria flava]MCJ8503769.1 hypothetical protein [Kocuria flava]